MIWNIMDLAEYTVKALLLLYLCRDIIEVKEKYRSFGKILFFIQSVAVNYWLSHSERLDRILYGENLDMIRHSSNSVVKMLIVFGVSFLFMDLLYQGKRLSKVYLLLVFYAMKEMSRFALHGLWMLGNTVYLDRLSEMVLGGRLEIEVFYGMVERWEYVNNLVFAAGYLIVMSVTIFFYRKHCREMADEIERQGLYFLMLTPFISMAFDIVLRMSFYTQTGNEIEFLYDRHGSMYAVVPVTTVLCLISIVYSRKIYSSLKQSEEEQNSLLFYKQQMSDMSAHVKEMEQLYDGIRGMRHDVNNYVADMEQLILMSTKEGGLSAETEAEARRYLHGMEQAVEGLSGRFHTGNPVTDVILNRKWQICEKESIAFTEEFLFPVNSGIEAFDIGILLNNALDNAIEACRNVGEAAGRFIEIRSRLKGRMFFLTIENSYEGNLIKTKNGMLQTTKQDGNMHGLGMSNMRNCVDRYYGTMQYQAENGRFILTVMLEGAE